MTVQELIDELTALPDELKAEPIQFGYDTEEADDLDSRFLTPEVDTVLLPPQVSSFHRGVVLAAQY